MRPQLIGIAGAAGCGKDTLARGLRSISGYPIHRMADPLKRALEAMFGFSPALWDDRERKEEVLPWLGKSPRYLAQTLGTEWGRLLVHEDLWVLLADRAFKEHGCLIVPDIRYDNEAAWIEDNDGILLYIDRPDEPLLDTTHVSEDGIDMSYVDEIIVNNGTVEDLIDTAWEEICRRG